MQPDYNQGPMQPDDTQGPMQPDDIPEPMDPDDIPEPMDPDDSVWLRDMRKDALLQYQTLTFLQKHMDHDTAKTLHREVGIFSLNSLKLRAFIQRFNVLYLDESFEAVGGIQGPDDMNAPQRKWSCRDINGCINYTIHQCTELGWPLTTSV